MIIEYIRYRISSKQHNNFTEAIKLANDILYSTPECLRAELSVCDEDSEVFIWRIEWESKEKHLEGFRKNDIFPRFFELVKPFYTNILEMKHYTLVDISD